MGSFVTNIVVAVIWVGLTSTVTAVNIVFGFVVGFVLISAFQSSENGSGYTRRTLAFIYFMLYFLKAFLVSNVTIAIAVLFRPRSSINPNIITFDVSGMTVGEIVFLSHCITLTPGTTTIDVSDDLKTIHVHAFDASDIPAVRKSIEKDLKQPILRFTR